VAETREKNKSQRERIASEIKEVVATVLDIVPDHVVLVGPHIVPKTSSGKLQRAACKTLYMKGRLSKIQIPAWVQMAKLGITSLLHTSAAALTVFMKFIYTLYMVLIVGITFLPVFLLMKYSSRDFAVDTCRIWARWVLRLGCCPVKVVGQENLTQLTPVIYASNHASYIDSLVMLAIMPTKTRFVVKKELFYTPVLRTIVRKLDYLGVNRLDLSKGVEDTKYIEAALKNNVPILIFPEGTFGYVSGLRPFRLGAFKIATETGASICPIALKGTRTILRDDEKLMRPGRITITVCGPIQPRGAEWQDVTQLRQVVRSEIAKYCGEPSLDFIAAQSIVPKRTHND
jgi:1-acyl-sn-glycerol-3-phosphate acyltransferase